MPFSPSDLGSDLVGWWDATDLSAGTVDLWPDKSASNVDLTTNDGTTPTSGSRTINGLNVVDFDAGDYLYSTDPLVAPTPLVLGLAVQLDVESPFQQFFGDFGASMFFTADTPAWAFGSLLGGTPDSEPHVLVAVSNGATSSLRLDGVEIATGDAVIGGFTAQVFCGAPDMVIGEMVVANGTSHSALEDFLIARWLTAPEPPPDEDQTEQHGGSPGPTRFQIQRERKLKEDDELLTILLGT